MRAKLAGLPIPPTEQQAVQMKNIIVDDKLKQIERKIKDVEMASKTKKMSPAEMRAGIELLYQKYNFNPVEELIVTAQQTDDASLSTRICMFLTEFLVPKLKSVEVSGTVDHNHTVVIRRFGPDGPSDSPMKRLEGMDTKRVDVAINAEVYRG